MKIELYLSNHKVEINDDIDFVYANVVLNPGERTYEPKNFSSTVHYVVYNPDGTENGSANVTTTASALTIVLAPQQTGYTVGGYYTTANLQTKVANAQVNGKAALVKGVTDWTDNQKGYWIAGDGKTIYIKWTPNTYDVTINPDNGGDNISAKVTYNDNKLTNLIAPTKTGYELKGYFKPIPK